ncbi:hypothetical protein PTTG_07577 [Puccinia triticina 1-1 BBBD Race 1]|uniref:ABC transmembrane type-1 domain-containing protein n=1 Tax=Puccinia triticina (isolate 1-1 / race 1 (BBBD)) TaxID=630390 RepID=A0A180GNB2_PUCT1|nr:hypothetical protein PTTG_07577 [Puccinia triticina 1-1 BBBD Race 1]
MSFLWGLFIDMFTSPKQLSAFLSSLLTGLFLVGSGAKSFQIILVHITGQRIINRLHSAAFASIMRADISWQDLYGTKALVTVLAGVLMMFQISLKLTVVPPPTAIGTTSKKVSQSSHIALAQITSHTEEEINQLQTVHNFNAVPIQTNSFNKKANI